MKKKSLAEKDGEFLAELVMMIAHRRYNAAQGVKTVQTCINILQKRITEIQPKKATPEYLLARYRRGKADKPPGK